MFHFVISKRTEPTFLDWTWVIVPFSYYCKVSELLFVFNQLFIRLVVKYTYLILVLIQNRVTSRGNAPRGSGFGGPSRGGGRGGRGGLGNGSMGGRGSGAVNPRRTS